MCVVCSATSQTHKSVKKWELNIPEIPAPQFHIHSIIFSSPIISKDNPIMVLKCLYTVAKNKFLSNTSSILRKVSALQKISVSDFLNIFRFDTLMPLIIYNMAYHEDLHFSAYCCL